MGFEIVVRPAILPDIRPPPARALLPVDAPDKGVALLSGNGGGVIDLPWSQNSSWSRNRQVEVVRHFDKVRVYASNADGSLNREEYVEYEVLTAIEYKQDGQTAIGQVFAHPLESESVEVIARGMTRFNSD